MTTRYASVTHETAGMMPIFNMISSRVSPEPLRILYWLSLCLSIFTIALSLMALGLLNLTIIPAVSCVTLAYLVVIFILERRHKRRKVQFNDLDSQSSLHPFPVPSYSTLPSVVVVFLLGVWWFAVAIASFFGLVSTEWGGWSLHLTLVSAYFYAAVAETAVCFASAIIIRRESGLSI